MRECKEALLLSERRLHQLLSDPSKMIPHVLLVLVGLPAVHSFGLRGLALPLRSSSSHPCIMGVARRPAALLIVPRHATMSASAESMASFSRALVVAGDHAIAAAAILEGNQCDDNDPAGSASLMAGGRAIANAGKDAEAVAAALAAREWEDATGPLQACASSLFCAAAALADVGSCGVAFGEAGLEIEDASLVSGCIALAAAAGPSLVSAGETISSAGGAMGAHANSMAKNGGVHETAGKRLFQAGAALSEAGESLVKSGCALEQGA